MRTTALLLIGLVCWSALPSAFAAEADDIARLIEQLGDSDLTKRQEAIRLLEKVGEPAVGPLRKAAKSHTDPDVRLRAAVAASLIEKQQTGEVRKIDAHKGWAGRVALTPDGKRAVSLGMDGLKLWDLEKGTLVRAFGGGLGWGLSIAADGKSALASGQDFVVRHWDLENGKELRAFPAHRDFVWLAALSPDGKLAATGGQDRSVVVRDVATGKEVWRTNSADVPRCCTFTPDGSKLIVGHFTPATVRVWDVKTGKELLALTGHTNFISSVTVSPDGKSVLSASFDGTVRLWDLATGRELKKLTPNRRGVDHAVFTPDGKRIVTCDWDGDQPDGDRSVRVIDLEKGTELRRFEGHERGPATVVVTPDGKHALTAGKDGTLRLWRLPP